MFYAGEVELPWYARLLGLSKVWSMVAWYPSCCPVLYRVHLDHPTSISSQSTSSPLHVGPVS